MKPSKPNKTESAFVTNKEVKTLAGFTNAKRGDKIKDINISLYDVDYAVKWHLENVINPTVVEENSVITVPILFAAGEKWSAVQKHGYLRDNQGKILTPMVMIKRNSVSKREDIQDLKVSETSDSRITFERKYTKQNRYDRFSLTGKTPEKEFYSIDVPKFVQVEYELLIWTNNTIQLNEVVEQLMWFDGKAFGDSHKFITHIEPPSFENINSTGEDRIVRASMPMRTKAYILNTHGPNAPALYRMTSVNRLIISQEIDGVTETNTITNAAIAVSSPSPSSGAGSGGAAAASALLYINSNLQLTGTVLNSSAVSFASGWTSAPTSLPTTSVDNFIFYVNGVLLERSAIISFTQSSGVSSLVVNTTNLGYSLDTMDEVIGIGKFINQDSLA
jgi:hypothetical protein